MPGADDEQYAAARARIAAQRGLLRGWRPLPVGGVTVVAAQVLGMTPGQGDAVGLRFVVAARDPAVLAEQGPPALEYALHKRGILDQDDVLEVAAMGKTVEARGPVAHDDPLTWPFASFVVHVPVERLPAIAGLATDQVRG